jgi:hypothetical protein
LRAQRWTQTQEQKLQSIYPQKMLTRMESEAIAIDNKTDSLFVPNVITPNGDLRNDEFQAVGSVEIFSTQIYNRYGEQVYESVANQPWRGDVSGGVYFLAYSVP